MKDVYIREGATFEETLTDTDITAQTATITISEADGTILISETANFSVVDDEAVATVTVDTDGLAIGNYEYMYTVVYEHGFILKLPDTSKCGTSPCPLPKFIVCDANDVPPEGS